MANTSLQGSRELLGYLKFLDGCFPEELLDKSGIICRRAGPLVLSQSPNLTAP